MNIPNKIGPFKRYLASPTTLKYGFYYCAKFKLPFHKEERYIRVWLPPNYDFENKNKRFPTIYFSDGQNLVDSYLSAYGEWKFDKVVNKLLKHDGVSCIAVGIDCPKIPRERCNELNPPYPVRSIYARKEGPNHPFADKYIDYIRFTLKPLIDSLFYTKTDKENTLDNIELAWGKKKAISTTVTNGQPDFTGQYAGLTNADFAKGSVCFIITN